MNWPRIVLDGILMCLLFNAVVGMGFMQARQDRQESIRNNVENSHRVFLLTPAW